MINVSFRGGTLAEVCNILRACGMPLNKIRFSRAVYMQGEYRYRVNVPDAVKIRLDAMRCKSQKKETA